MEFNVQRWKQEFGDLLRNISEIGTKVGTHGMYAYISMLSLLPVANAVSQGNDAALLILANVAGSVGSSIIATELTRLRDKVDDTSHTNELQKWIQVKILSDPEVLRALQQILEHLNTVELIETALVLSDDDMMRIRNVFKEELMSLKLNERLEPANNVNIFNMITLEYSKATGKDLEVGDLKSKLEGYLKWIIDTYGKITLRGIELKGRQVVELDLNEVYVSLEAEILESTDDLKTIRIEKLLSIGNHIAVIGGPGSGKTTVLQYVAYTIADLLLSDNLFESESRLGIKGPLPIPIFLSLSSFATFRKGEGTKRDLLDFVSIELNHVELQLGLPKGFFQQLLIRGRTVILLLDGLDEVADESERWLIRQSIEDVVSRRRESLRAIVTCRTTAYHGMSALGLGFKEVIVKPLTRAQAIDILSTAYRYIYKYDPLLGETRLDELVEGIDKLEASFGIQESKGTWVLVNSPLLVRMLIIVHFKNNQLPQHRATFYITATESMLSPDYALDANVPYILGGLVGGSVNKHREIIQYLAFRLHERGPKQGREIEEDELRNVLAQDDFDHDIIDGLIKVTRQRGTLLEERLQTYRFIHHSFQEYFVARYLAEVVRQPESIVKYLVTRPILDTWWREPCLLSASYLDLTSPRQGENFIKELSGMNLENEELEGNPTITLARCEIAASALLELHSAKTSLRVNLSSHVRKIFSNYTILTNSTPFIRTRFGTTIAQFGDPRPDVLTVSDLNLCYIPAGDFMFGDPDSMKDRSADNVMIDYRYWVSQYPITNAQYTQFILDDGYRKPQYWQEAITLGIWSGGRIRGTMEEEYGEGPKKYPYPFNAPNHPIVGINFFEATAYVRWLTENWRSDAKIDNEWEVRLPSEIEWEKAARGGNLIPKNPLISPMASFLLNPFDILLKDNDLPSRRYPWGDNYDPNLANTEETHLKSTNAVGCFPGGDSPFGVSEMSGNVTEWTQSLWESLTDHNDHRKFEAQRVIRGGAFQFVSRYARCSMRVGFDPGHRDQTRGFRIAVCPIL
jgi:formylglycine-generating enzyme required for sulfatase activity